MSTEQSPAPGQIRCSDTDRRLVTDVLDAAFAEGRVTLDEHAERVEGALRARTFADLTGLVDDLAPLPVAASSYSSPAPSAVVDTTHAQAGPDRMVAVFGDVRRTGAWRLRQHTTGITVLGDIKLDLRQAVMEAHECILDLPTILGDVKIQVPAGVNVRDETVGILGSSRIRGLEGVDAHSPTIVLRGWLVLGDIKVTGPGHVGLPAKLGLSR